MGGFCVNKMQYGLYYLNIEKISKNIEKIQKSTCQILHFGVECKML